MPQKAKAHWHMEREGCVMLKTLTTSPSQLTSSKPAVYLQARSARMAGGMKSRKCHALTRMKHSPANSRKSIPISS